MSPAMKSMRRGRGAGISTAVAAALIGTVALTVSPASAQPTATDAGAPATEASEAAQGGDNLVIQWNKMAYDASVKTAAKTNGLKRPPLGSRVYATVHSCIYDAWAAYDYKAVGTQLGDDLRQPYYKRTLANRKTAINYAAYDALVYLFPDFKADFDAKLQQLGLDPANTTRNTTTPAGVAHTACDAVIAVRRADGSNQDNNYADTTGYQAVNPPQDFNAFDKSTIVDPNRWTPLTTNGVTPSFATPQWGDITPFAIKDPASFLPPAPPVYGSAASQADIKTLMDVNAKLTDREKVIAEYWLERSETPTGHQNQWAQFISHRDGNTLSEDVKMFFALNLAMGDSGIVAWKTKVHYDYSRPITMIRYDQSGKTVQGYGGPGKGTQTIDGSAWKPYVTTPAFGSYVSGHAVWGAAAAEALKLWTGSDKFGDSFTFKAGTSTFEPGQTPAADVTLKWNTLSEAAAEDGMSRIYGGVHWTFDNLEGQKVGRTVAKATHAQALRYINGTA
ncbi:vanadium-dependent haloperoxidase [Streptomyces vilmorinianum]|uniref:vanadium-dependent haloperoxidase n=1 Tax=Streptomyces vilmorinianum TaxID=3051092 RepID=UPI0010FB1276|nr:vanadium-dependent haloperoxidase [Streptomyces vilmorinianum]